MSSPKGQLKTRAAVADIGAPKAPIVASEMAKFTRIQFKGVLFCKGEHGQIPFSTEIKCSAANPSWPFAAVPTAPKPIHIYRLDSIQ